MVPGYSAQTTYHIMGCAKCWWASESMHWFAQWPVYSGTRLKGRAPRIKGVVRAGFMEMRELQGSLCSNVLGHGQAPEAESDSFWRTLALTYLALIGGLRGCDSCRCCRLYWDAFGPKNAQIARCKAYPRGTRAYPAYPPRCVLKAIRNRPEGVFFRYGTGRVPLCTPYPCEPLCTPYPAFAAYPCAAVCSTGILVCFRRPRPVYTLEHNSLNLDAQFAHRVRQICVFWRYKRALQYTSGTSLYTKPWHRPFIPRAMPKASSMDFV